MNKLEKIALSTGSKIGRPHIYTQFFPLPIEKYVSFHSDDAEPSKNYSFIQDTINILTPALSKEGIRIVQVGDAKERSFSNCVNLKGAANTNQIAYIIKNSMLHFGSDGFPIHVAAGFDIPLVSIYSNNYVECDKPYFGSLEKQILLTSYDRLETKKPSFSNDENPKSINLIKPEEIAEAVLKLLNIKHIIPFDSVFFGKKYSSFKIQESFLDHNGTMFNPELLVELRADRGQFSEESFFYQLSQYKKSIVILDRPVNLNILSQFKPNIQMIAFKLTEADHKAFLVQLEGLGIKLVLVSELPQEKVDELKIKYYEFGIINRVDTVPQDKINELKRDVESLYYRSSKLTASKNNVFSSQAAATANVPTKSLDEYEKVIDSEEFWKELDFFTLVKKK